MPFGDAVSTIHQVKQTENAAKNHGERKGKDGNLAQKRSSGKVKELLKAPALKQGANKLPLVVCFLLWSGSWSLQINRTASMKYTVRNRCLLQSEKTTKSEFLLFCLSNSNNIFLMVE